MTFTIAALNMPGTPPQPREDLTFLPLHTGCPQAQAYIAGTLLIHTMVMIKGGSALHFNPFVVLYLALEVFSVGRL